MPGPLMFLKWEFQLCVQTLKMYRHMYVIILSWKKLWYIRLLTCSIYYGDGIFKRKKTLYLKHIVIICIIWLPFCMTMIICLWIHRYRFLKHILMQGRKESWWTTAYFYCDFYVLCTVAGVQKTFERVKWECIWGSYDNY